ncbi:MAG: LysM peptidoglycan-binding domain-containing protein [Arcobacteraceae bacterium]
MYRLIFLFLLYFSSLHAALVGSNFNNQDINILNELDIESSFITDYELQQSYSRYAKSNHFYKQKLSDSTLFIPIIKNILRKEGVPSSFVYLAMAESNFNISARGQKAMGLWQFMPETGKLLGLNNNLYVDERLDLIKSSHAATKYLKRLHEKFGKWYLAAMAYNAGEGRIIEGLTRATIDLYIEKNGTESRQKQVASYSKILNEYKSRKGGYRDLYSVYNEVKTWGVTPSIYTLLTTHKDVKRQYIPTETREYIRKIVALGMMNNKSFISDDDSHLLNMGNTNTAIATIQVKGGLHLQSIASAVGMSYADLVKLNLHIKEHIIPPFVKEYDVYIPYSRLSRYNLNKDNIGNDRFTIHQVKQGDSLASISKQYNVTLSVIKDFNKLSSGKLSPKQKLILPIVSELTQKLPFHNINNVKSYYVQKGDTLENISKRYNIAPEKLMKDNNLENSSLNIGDKLVFNY